MRNGGKNTPKKPRMRFLGRFRGVVTGAVHMTGDTPWEMHPGGDECLHLLSGAIDVILDDGGAQQTIELHAGRACVIPRGMWHRQIVREPGELLFITPGIGTQLRAGGRNVTIVAAGNDMSKAVASRSVTSG